MRIARWTPRVAGVTEDISAEGILKKISPKDIPSSAKQVGEPILYWSTRYTFDFPDPELGRCGLSGPQAERCLERRIKGATHYTVGEVSESDSFKEVYIQGERARGYSVTFYRIK